MIALGVIYALLSGIANGLFTAPMKIIPRWKWENIWLIFILTACWAMPLVLVAATVGDFRPVVAASPPAAVAAALAFGFSWGFGAILFGLSVDRLGVSLANTLVLGLSSALGSLVPLLLAGTLRLEARQLVLFLGVAVFIAGISVCSSAGRLRDAVEAGSEKRPSLAGYLFAVGAGVMSAVFNIGYSLALPIAATGERMGFSSFFSINIIWLLMLGAGALPNIGYCSLLFQRNRSGRLFADPEPVKTWGLSITMGLLWGGSIFLYGAATPLLGDIGPSIGWPLSLAVGLLVANLMGFLLGEWRKAGRPAVARMRFGILMLLAAIVLCAVSTKLGNA